MMKKVPLADPEDVTFTSPSGSSKTGDENKVRGNWSHQIEFTLSCIGYSVGLGNIWRFPYLCMRNGGGAFLIPYFTFLFVCGMPLFFMELVLGQFSGLGLTMVWKLCPILKGIGWTSLIMSFIWLVNYNIILSWTLYFLGKSCALDVPWRTCDNPWNTPNCLTLRGSNGTLANEILANDTALDPGAVQSLNTSLYESDGSSKTAAEEFFMFNVLQISSGIDEVGGVKWQLVLCLLATCTIVFLCLCKGIKSSGKVIYVTATVPYLFLTILFIRGVTLPGSLGGIKFYIIPDWSRLLEFRVWREACVQIFYTLGPAWGNLITMASYNRFHHNCLKDSFIVSCTCCATSFYAGFVIFSVIGFMAHDAGVPVDKVITQGPGLAFVAYPEALARLPISPFWAICFFLMLLTVGLDSQFAVLETIASALIDELPKYIRKYRMLFVLMLSILCFLLGMPLTTGAGMYLFQVIDWYFATFTVLVGFLETIIICYIYGIGRFYDDMTLILKKRPSKIWAVCWGGIVPVSLLVVLVISVAKMSPPTYGTYKYPGWAIAMGWASALVSVATIPVVAIWAVATAKGTFTQRMLRVTRPESDWGPALDKYKEEYNLSQTRRRTWLQRMKFSQYSYVHYGNGNEPSGEPLKPLNYT